MNEQGTSRRRLLRGAAAGLAGGAAAVTVPSQAQAAVNDPVLLGAVNNSGTSPTTLNSSAATDPTLTLVNPTGPTLRLGNPGLTMNLPPALGKGTFFSRSGYGDVQIEDTPSGLENKANWLYTDRIALMTLPVTPTRVLDTRTSSGRANIVYGAGSISSGRLGTNKLIVVRMDHLVSFGEGVRMNVTVTQTGGRGYVAVWGRGTKPDISSLNWWGAGQTLSNTVLSQLGFYSSASVSASDVIAIFTNQTAAIVVDVQAFIVGSPWQVVSFVGNPAPGATQGATGSRATGKSLVGQESGADPGASRLPAPARFGWSAERELTAGESE